MSTIDDDPDRMLDRYDDTDEDEAPGLVVPPGHEDVAERDADEVEL